MVLRLSVIRLGFRRQPEPPTQAAQKLSRTSLNLFLGISHYETTPRPSVAMSTAELATSYAALILADDGVDITVRNGPANVWKKIC